MSAAANARTHGAQSRPAEAAVVAHLARILGRPVSGLDRLAPDPQTLAALRLADCEARLDRALEHHAAQFATKRDPEADRLSESVADLLHFDWVEDRDRREAARRVMKLDQFSVDISARRKRLASRYLREAQPARDRALAAYLELNIKLPKQK